MADVKVKKDLKERIDRLRRKIKQRKVEGEVKIPGVDKPKKQQVKEPHGKRPEQAKRKTRAMGPRGGQFIVGPTGKRIYDRTTKSVVDEVFAEETFKAFFQSFKSRSN